MMEFYISLFAILFVSAACTTLVTIFAVWMGWFPGVNLAIAKIALKEMYQEIKGTFKK